MASIGIQEGELIVEFHGWCRVLTLRNGLRVPLSRVRAVRTNPPEAHFDDVIVETWRGLGTYVPGKVCAGKIYLKDGPAFFQVSGDPERVLALDLDDERMHHLVVEVDGETPAEAAERILHAMGRPGVAPVGHTPAAIPRDPQSGH
jgi:hypothetical protein